MGPFFVNSVLALALALPTYISREVYNEKNIWFMFVLWLSISIAMHAIPSNQDARNVFEQAKVHAKKGNILAIVSFPIVICIFVFNLLRVVWSDALYAYGLCVGVSGILAAKFFL